MDLSIIIVSWNVSNLLKKCINSIYKRTQGISFEVFVIDNASADNTVQIIRKNFSQVKLIINQENKGFAGANNQGIKGAEGDYVLLLNPDTELKEDSFTKMVKFMKDNPKCGIAGCHLLNPDGSHQDSVRRFPKFLDQALILLKLHHIFPQFAPFQHYLCKDFDYKQEQQVDQVMGAFFMIRRKVIEQIGLLDEKFFIWFEEVDYCQRAKAAGWQVIYTPLTSIIHHFGQSFKQVMTIKKQKIWNRSLRYYFFKHYGFWKYAVIALLSWISLGLVYLLNFKAQILKLKTTTQILNLKKILRT